MQVYVQIVGEILNEDIDIVWRVCFNNCDMTNTAQRRYYEKNRELINAKSRARNKMPERKAYMKAYAKKNRDKLRAYGKQYNVENKEHYQQLRLELKKQAMQAYGGVCTCCGEDRIEFLSINHINNDGAKHREEIFGKRQVTSGGGTRFYYWLRRNEYPEGFEVLCMNCNCARGFYGYCPHEKER